MASRRCDISLPSHNPTWLSTFSIEIILWQATWYNGKISELRMCFQCQHSHLILDVNFDISVPLILVSSFTKWVIYIIVVLWECKYGILGKQFSTICSYTWQVAFYPSLLPSLRFISCLSLFSLLWHFISSSELKSYINLHAYFPLHLLWGQDYFTHLYIPYI